MSKYILKITLLSDLCVSDGGVYNSSLDTDICYDEYGLPFIPAKRIKGCLRESAIELKDWGIDIDTKKIFGDAGQNTNKGIIRISNAYLEDYETIKQEITEYKDCSDLLHTQNVLNYYSYIRTQTAIDYETGVADEQSLRTMRVAKKGLVFVAEVDCQDLIDCKTPIDELDIDNSVSNGFRLCVSNFSSMGIARTRGLGEVKAELLSDDNQMEKQNSCDTKITVSDKELLEYTIKLEEPIICKSINGGESNSMDYLEGSKIMGLVIQRMKGSQDFDFSLFDGVTFSNAYISDETKRFLEVPAYIYGIKNNSKEYINKVLEKQEIDVTDNKKLEQFNQMKHTYVCFDDEGNLTKKNVKLETRYHHSRPEDKSIGRADTRKDNSKFYSLSSICEGQILKGFIKGDSDKLQKIAEAISVDSTCYLGYGNSSEYGKCNISVNVFTDEENNYSDGIIVKLNAPTVIYNDKAMYSTEKKDLLEEILVRLNLEDKDIENPRFFVNYTTIGGFNVTWNHRKPNIAAFDKGTAVVFKIKEKTMRHNSIMFIGERTREGYGECELIQVVEDNPYRLAITKEAGQTGDVDKKIPVKEGSLIKELADDNLKTFIRDTAFNKAHADFGKEISDEKNKKAYNSTVSNMLLMCKENNTIADLIKSVEERYAETDQETKEKKLRNAKKILNNCIGETSENQKNAVEVFLGDYSEKFKLDNYEGLENMDLMYLEAYLLSMKYMIRQKSNNNAKGE